MAIDQLKKIIFQSATLNKLLVALREHNQLFIKGLSGSLKSIILAIIFETWSSNLIYIAHDEQEAELVKDDLENILDENYVAFFPDQKDRPYEAIFFDLSRKGLYQEAFEKIINNQKILSIITASSFSKKLLPAYKIKNLSIVLKKGNLYDFELFKLRLSELGFNREPIVESFGEMSVRGGIVDIFPYSREYPLRIEFFGDQIESIREFDITTQRSIKSISQTIIYPQFPQDAGDDGDFKLVSLLDYFGKDTVVVIDEINLVERVIDENFEEAKHQYHLRMKREKLLPPENNYLTWDNVRSELTSFKTIFIDSFVRNQKFIYDFHGISQESLKGNFNLLKEKIDYLLNNRKRAYQKNPADIFFLCDSHDRVERLEEIMIDVGIDLTSIHLTVCPLTRGFIFDEANLAVFTDSQFYGRIHFTKRKKRFLKGLSFRQFKALVKGDYIVHVDYGIGKYLGLKKITVGGYERECITIEYRDDDLLYVPLEKMNRIQKYSAKEGIVPQISKLGGNDWERLKKRTKKRVKDIARELINLYAKRKSQQGFAFSEDTPWQKELEASFGYEETTDQITATEDIKQDMESSKPMERLICGDVGYGKTEVALRAAFKAVNDNKQVAILVPTTVLALQHFNTFKERLKDYPVKVEMLSRFRSRIEQQKIISWLKDGKIDIIIGTHRLLSEDVFYKDLGLIIIDEEQRFGVRHKEKLKQIKTTSDILTMTATPIPRTLSMALMGIRDMSIINTPPEGRLPIYTQVISFDNKLIRMAILKEVERGGQVFFVHNRVQSIEAIAILLRRIVPEVSFAIAHGKMEERHLEKVMWEFATNKYHCLISTMIIESGLDIPNVNTLIVNRADRFGLSQLYQLRGRVGRSNQRAYAYLITPPLKHLTKETISRLRTIEEFTELGSGFQIAMRDLHIRGAGNILGTEQSGFIVSLGFELYSKILDEAITEIKLEKGEAVQPKSNRVSETKVDLNVDTYLPQNYVQQSEERVNFYKRLVEVKQKADLDEIESEMKDRFGPLPNEAKNLLYLIELKILGAQLKIKYISIDSNRLYAQFHDEIMKEERELLQRRLVSIVNNARYPFTFVQNHRQSLGLRLPFSNNTSDNLNYSKNFLQSLL